MNVIVTGGAGFIGSALIRELINNTDHQVLNIDKLTYAANPAALGEVARSPRYSFLQADICDSAAIKKAFAEFKPDTLMHLAAESHVDRSISGPSEFIHTNITGTFSLLEIARDYCSAGRRFLFHHVSTDEVFGDLGPGDSPFSENSPYRPSSPYSASKAGADHLVRAWHRTYNLPAIISTSSNNYGPYQHPEKLIPLVITNALNGQPLPIYGTGKQQRDWLYVEDHARALISIITAGTPGETYNIGGNCEKQNIEVVNAICAILDKLCPRKAGAGDFTSHSSYSELITFVTDRPGHDWRYALNTDKIKRGLNWQPQESFQTGLQKTVQHYLSLMPQQKQPVSKPAHLPAPSN